MPSTTRSDGPSEAPLFVVPCLNEANHIRSVLAWLIRSRERLGGTIVVADGGSTDGTRKIVASLAARTPGLHLLDNPDRFQSAAINRAVEAYGNGAMHLVRIDAHAAYPEDFCDILLSEAQAADAAAVVVSLNAEGETLVQRAIAAAQNAPVGNGGARHRMRPAGGYVDHGHHALMDLDAFRAVGGYDASFSHNEDAELDHRLCRAGYRIWLTGQTEVTYFPRKTLAALFRQYFNFGAGRSRNLLKHRARPNLRQIKAIAILPLVALAYLTPLSPFFALPAIAWISYCLTMAMERAWLARDVTLVLVAPMAMTMHIAWSYGFWRHALQPRHLIVQRAA